METKTLRYKSRKTRETQYKFQLLCYMIIILRLQEEEHAAYKLDNIEEFVINLSNVFKTYLCNNINIFTLRN